LTDDALRRILSRSTGPANPCWCRACYALWEQVRGAARTCPECGQPTVQVMTDGDLRAYVAALLSTPEAIAAEAELAEELALASRAAALEPAEEAALRAVVRVMGEARRRLLGG
jgi:hypothetical protein